MQENPLIIYHRGRHGDIGGRQIKENTLEAFEAAVAEHAFMIEFDVWENLRITHDPSPKHSTPTLPEALDVIRGRSAVNIEIKDPLALWETMAVVHQALSSGHWEEEQFVFSSFHHETAVIIKKIFDCRVGIINDGVLCGDYLHYLASKRIDNLHMEWMNVYMDIRSSFTKNTLGMRDLVKSLGMQIWVWTVNDRNVWQTVKEYGANAVFTDRPDLFR